MSAVHKLITDHLDIWTAADTEKKSGRGRASGNANSVYGIKKLRELILELAVRGKLVPQDPNDEPASELLKRIQAEKVKLISEGAIKKEKIHAHISEVDLNYTKPKGWEFVSISRITLLITDGTHHTPKYQDQGVPFISVKDINGKTVSFDDCKYLTQEEHEQINLRCNPERDDILLCRIGTLGRATIVDTDKAFSLFVSVGLLKMPKSIKFAKYIHLTLSSPLLYSQFDTIKAGGSHTNKLNLGEIPRLSVPIPPLQEQRRIVAKVDELMALCDQLESQHNNATDAHEQLVSHLLSTLTQSQDAEDFNANWQRIATHFDTLFTTESSIDALKQTLLQLAVMGKLVPQDPNDEPASELLQRIQVEKSMLVTEGKIKKTKPLAAIGDSPFDLPLNWAWARFPEVGEFGRGKSKHRPRNDPKLFNPEIYPLVQTGEVARADNLISEFHSKYSEIGLAQSKMWPQGTMCITIAANIADSAILGFDACFPDSVVGFVPYTPLKDARYFLYFMKTARADLLKFAPATAQKNINLEILESVLIPIPPLNEISRIVAKVDELMTLCEHLKSRITDSRQNQRKLADVLMDQALML